MEYSEIETMFTYEIINFTSIGYRICTNTMGGTQGEIARIDMIKDGRWFVRISLDREFDDEGEKLVISIGRMDARNFQDGVLSDGKLHEGGVTVFAGRDLTFPKSGIRVFRRNGALANSFTEEVRK